MKREQKAEPAPAQSGQSMHQRLGELSAIEAGGGHGFIICDSHGDCVAEVPYDGTGYEREHATVFACAPELIEALRECEAYITALARQTGNQTDTWNSATMAGNAQTKARTILAKIGGKQ